jgi:putative ABC transport system permease protein
VIAKGLASRFELAVVATEQLRRHPVQTSLTLAGFVAGTASIVLVVSLGLTGRGYVLQQIEGVGSKLVWANYRGSVTDGVSRTGEDFLNDADVRAVAARGDLFAGVTGLVTVRGDVEVQSRLKTLTVLGAMASYVPVRHNLRILRGRFLDEDDVLERARVCVVNRPLYEALFPSEDSSAKTIRTLGTSFRVIGEFEEPVDTLGQGEVVPETIFIPVTVAWAYLPARRPLDTLFAEVRDSPEIPVAANTVQEILQERHRRGTVFEVDSMTTVLRLARLISAGLIAVFVLAGAITVVVGGVGIMNILLVSVEQRTREIGVRMSVGARRTDILGQFLVEALALGMIGSLAGVAIGLGIPALASALLPTIPIRVSVLSAVLAFAFSCAVALAFGAVPAYRASRLNPAEAVHLE